MNYLGERTNQDLIKLFRGTFLPRDTNKDPKELRYILYARKSTESAERQIRSLDDQIKECREFADRLGLHIAKITRESESAKEPGIRPEFRKMLEAVEKGKYDGILAWHPDRLARNMKEAGEIIDLLDKEIIKSLKFVSFTFDNSPSGKMLLGIAFVLSKEYSDKLSDDVKRGIKRSLEEGKYIHHPKKGYIKDRNQYLRPDGRNFEILKEAFQMRINGKRLEEIAKFINDSQFSYQRKVDGERVIYKMTVKKLSEILRDPFYTGLLVYGNDLRDMTELYDFVPMVTADEFLTINHISDITKALRMTASYQRPGIIKADLMRNMVICSHCNENMTAGITPKKTKDGEVRYYYFRCDSVDCTNYGKSIRAKTVINFAKEFLGNHALQNEVAYARYAEEMRVLKKDKIRLCQKELASLRAQQGKLSSNFEKTKDVIKNETDEETKKIFKGDLKTIQTQLSQVENRVAELKEYEKSLESLDLSFSTFLELFKKLPDLLEKPMNLKDLDFIMRKIFLNFTIKDKKVANFSINYPFNELFKTDEFLVGRGTGN